MEDALAKLVSQALGKRSIREGAEVCGIADYLLRDVILMKTRRPAPATLYALTRLSDTLTIEQLALAAYGILHVPSEEDLIVNLPVAVG